MSLGLYVTSTMKNFDFWVRGGLPFNGSLFSHQHSLSHTRHYPTHIIIHSFSLIKMSNHISDKPNLIS